MDEAERLAFEGWASLPQFKKKVEQAKSIIVEALAIAPAYVAISWGKDSIVMLHLVQGLHPNIKAIYHAHIERDLIANYSEIISRYTSKFPTDLIIQETDNADGNIGIHLNVYNDFPVCFLGLRAEESINRRRSLKRYGLIHQYQSTALKNSWRVCPLGWWGWRDIWAYIVSNDLPYLDAYDKIDKGSHESRTTCHISKTTNKQRQATRMENFRIISPRYHNYLKSNFPEMF